MLPVFLRTFGAVILMICFTTALSAQIPFQYFFQTLTIQTFVSGGIGAALASAGLKHVFKAIMKKSDLNPRAAIHPTFRTIRRFVKHELRTMPKD